MMETVSFASPVLLLAAVCAAVMGYAIQRSGTCMVAAVDELIEHRRATRLGALAEAGLWVAGSVLLWRWMGGYITLPIGYPPGLKSVLGGALLGLGALCAGACMFGAVARIGSGQWAFALTPLGYFLACATVAPHVGARPAMTGAAPLTGAAWLLVPLALFALWRFAKALHAARAGQFAAHVWHPHHATTVIGLAYSVLLIAVGPWAYTSALLALSQGTVMGIAIKLALFGVLLAGAVTSGWSAGQLRLRLPRPRTALRCLAGGFLMGSGSLLVPGGNDELVLLGLPMLQAYAALAAAGMVLAILAGRLAMRRTAPFPSAR